MMHFAAYEMAPFSSMGHASILCDETDEYLLDENWFNGNLDVMETTCSDNTTAEDSCSYSASTDDVVEEIDAGEEEENNDDAIFEVLSELYTKCPLVDNDDLAAMKAHFYRNRNLRNLSDDLIQRIRIFHDRFIFPVKSIEELKNLFEDVCMKKSELAARLAAIESVNDGISTVDAKLLKRELMKEQTAESRALLLALIANRAMHILGVSALSKYCRELNCSTITALSSGKVPERSELTFLTNCMGAISVVHQELQLDSSSKGMYITAAVMLANPLRTYSNGGRQAKSAKVLEGLFHEITKVERKPRAQNPTSVPRPKTASRKRKSGEMSEST